MAKSKSARQVSPHETNTEDAPATSSRPQRAKRGRREKTPEPDFVDIVGDDSQPASAVGPDAPHAPPPRAKKGKAKAPVVKRTRKQVVESEDEDNAEASDVDERRSPAAEDSFAAEDDLSVGRPSPAPSSSRLPPTKRKSVGARKRKNAELDDESDEHDVDAGRDHAESDIDDDVLVDSPPLKKKKLAPAAKSRGKAKDLISGKDERVARSVSRDEGTPMDIDSTSNASPAPSAAAALPSFKKKLPSMRKAGPTASGSGTPSSTSAPRPRTKTTNPPVADEPTSTLDFKKPKKTAAKQELNLMNKDIYDSLFKSGSAPRGGVDVKSKEEKRAAMNKLRDEDCARREAQWSNTFDLRAQHDKITEFAKGMDARKGPAIYPNILASSLRVEFEKRKKQEAQT